MAIIPCPECKKDVSSFAAFCPSCGYPISNTPDIGYVKIKTPYQLEKFTHCSLQKHWVTVSTKTGKTWVGELGEVARLKINGPTTVIIDLGKNAFTVSGTVYPNATYDLEFVRDISGIAEYRLVEI